MREHRYRFIVQFKGSTETLKSEGTINELHAIFMGLSLSMGNVKRILAKSIWIYFFLTFALFKLVESIAINIFVKWY